MTEYPLNPYTWAMNLTIRNLQIGDFRAYLCTADNGLGYHEARVRLKGESVPIILFIPLVIHAAANNNPVRVRVLTRKYAKYVPLSIAK